MNYCKKIISLICCVLLFFSLMITNLYANTLDDTIISTSEGTIEDITSSTQEEPEEDITFSTQEEPVDGIDDSLQEEIIDNPQAYETNDEKPINPNSGRYIDWDFHVAGETYEDGEVIVNFFEDLTDKNVVYEIAKASGCEVDHIIMWHDWNGGKSALFTIVDGSSVKDAIIRIEDNYSEYVKYASANWIYEAQSTAFKSPRSKDLYSGNNVDWDKLVPGKDYKDGEVIVTFNDDFNDKEYVYKIAEQCGCRVDHIIMWHEWEGGKAALFLIEDGASVSEAIDKLEYTGFVKFAENNALYKTCVGTNDTQAGSQWYLDKIGVPDAWDFAQCQGDVAVAVLDSGVQMNHPDLSGNILSNYAWDAINGTQLSSSYADSYGHGTHVAGIISAVANNLVGVAGISYNAKIIPVRVTDSNGTTSLDDVEDAYEYLLNNAGNINLKVINISSYGENNYHEGLGLIIQEAASEGIVTVCAGGNKTPGTGDPTEGYPSDYSASVSVTATDHNDVITDFSIGGHQKTIAAPGADILSTQHGSSYDFLDGTSMSAGIVSGVVALMFAANNNLTVDQVKNILNRTAVPYTTTPSMSGQYYGVGRVNAKDAVKRAVNGSWKRLSGTSRYYTMASIVKEGWHEDSCSTVIVATGATFPDALSGAALAGIYNCPLILTAQNSLSPGAQIALSYLDPDNIIILGSTSAVSSAVESALCSYVADSSHITRIEGSTRYETCYQIYQHGLGDWSDTLILATGATAPDALSVSSYSFASKSPVFLVQSGTTLQDNMKAAITSGAFNQVVILGAPEVISTSLENWVKAQVGSLNVIRLYGDDRYKTSSKIAEWASGNLPALSVQPVTVLSYTYPAMANGGNDHFADSLAAGPFCGYNESVILLTQNNTTTSNYTVQNNIIPHSNDIRVGFVIGSSGVLSEDFRAHLNMNTP